MHQVRGRWDGPEPPKPPKPPKRLDPHREPTDWIPDRVGQVLQRFDEFRERAEGMMVLADRFLNQARDQAPPPGQAEPRPPEPPEPPEHPEPAGPTGSD